MLSIAILSEAGIFRKYESAAIVLVFGSQPVHSTATVLSQIISDLPYNGKFWRG